MTDHHTQPTPLCTRCQKAMEEGFIADYATGGTQRSRWVEGAPRPSWWGGVKTSFRRQYSVSTYRCPECGYLESYARALHNSSTAQHDQKQK